MAAIDEQLLLAAEQWMKTEARERATAMNLQADHERRHNGGDLYKADKRGDELRERIRAAERSAKDAQDQALKIRREILGPVRRGAGAKEPVAEPPRARDPATQALIDKREREKREKEERRAQRSGGASPVVLGADVAEPEVAPTASVPPAQDLDETLKS
jgi:hypothetical protein